MNLLEHALDEGVTESEGGGGEVVDDGGVDGGVVLVVVAVGDGQDVELGHVVRPQDDGQPLVVGDVLHLCDLDPPGLLVEPLVLPVRVEVVQLGGQPVVFPHPHRVVDRQARLLVRSAVACKEIFTTRTFIELRSNSRTATATRRLLDIWAVTTFSD